LKLLDHLKNKDQRTDMLDEGKGSRTPLSASPVMEEAKKAQTSNESFNLLVTFP
jgi:hypothetical protein